MRVSVLIPVYNCSKYIGAAIESTLAQTFQDFEIIVIDDGSEDETASVVKQYKRVKYIYQPHSGVANARNRGLKEAKGEFICFVDADDIMHSEKIMKQVSYLDLHPDCEIVFCRYQSFSNIKENEMTMNQQRIYKPFYPCLVTALIRVHLFADEEETFCEQLNFGEDTHWLAKLLTSGVELNHYLEEELYYRRVHDSNMSLRCMQLSRNDYMQLLADAIRSRQKKTEK